MWHRRFRLPTVCFVCVALLGFVAAERRSTWAGNGPFDGADAFVTITYTGNAARLGAIATDSTVTPDTVSLVCGQANQGESTCGFPEGEACCRRELFNIQTGEFVRFVAVARRGQIWFGGWGGVCTQEPVACPFPVDLTSPEFLDLVCPGGMDRRGILVTSPSGLRNDSDAVFACDVTLATPGLTTEVVADWFTQRVAPLPGDCGFQLTELPCTSPPTPTTTTTTTTLPPVDPTCGDPDGSGDTTATDALRALQASVGSIVCLTCFCDVNGDGSVTATDALALLQKAVGAIEGAFDQCTGCSP